MDRPADRVPDETGRDEERIAGEEEAEEQAGFGEDDQVQDHECRGDDAGSAERLAPGVGVRQVGDHLDENVADLREQFFHVASVSASPENDTRATGPGVVLT